MLDSANDFTFSECADLIRRLPKTETHLHLEGALPFELLRKLDPERFREEPAFWAPDFRYSSFAHFEETLIAHALLWYTSAERYREAAEVVFRGLHAQTVRYVETSFHLGILQFLEDVSGPEIVSAIKSAAPLGMEVRVFAGMPRNLYTPEMRGTIDELHTWEELDGIDLHGVEPLPMEEWTARIWRKNREAGKMTKAHAGEFGGPENVRYAIEELDVKRIQHGVRAIEDPAVVDLIREREVALDLCPISNVKLQVVPSLREHPIRKFLQNGIVCTVSTDDPFSFGNRLSDEYLALAKELDFSAEELAQVAANGFKVALISEEERARHLKEIREAAAGFQPQVG